MARKQASKADLAAALDDDQSTEDQTAIEELDAQFEQKLPVEPGPIKLPSQFDLAQEVVDYVHNKYPGARSQDWTLFYNGLFLARRLLQRTWAQRKRQT